MTILKSYRPWDESDIIVKNVPHALSNEVYQVIHKETKEMVLVRLYLDRERAKTLDLNIPKEMGDLGLGPRILSTCPEGSCEEWINGRTMTYSEMMSEEYSNKLARAVKTLHGARITHGDLHHNNMMIDENNNVRLIDFEYAKRNSTDIDIAKDLANHFCECMYDYGSDDWHIPRPLGDQLEPHSMRFMTTYYSPEVPPQDCLSIIFAQNYDIHVKWVRWGLDYYEATSEQKYLDYAIARARMDPDVMATFSKEAKWQAHL